MADEIITFGGSHLNAKNGFFGIAGESRLRPRIVPKGTETRFVMRSDDDGRVTEVVVFNPDRTKMVMLRDPETGTETPVSPVVVHTVGPRGEIQQWGCRDLRNDELSFYPHPEYIHARVCTDCHGAKVIGASKCIACEGSGAVPNQVRVVFPHGVIPPEPIILKSTASTVFMNPSHN